MNFERYRENLSKIDELLSSLALRTDQKALFAGFIVETKHFLDLYDYTIEANGKLKSQKNSLKSGNLSLQSEKATLEKELKKLQEEHKELKLSTSDVRVQVAKLEGLIDGLREARE